LQIENPHVGERQVGKKVAILWKLTPSGFETTSHTSMNTWQHGVVQSYNIETRKHTIKYDDGTSEELDLLEAERNWKLL
jgi:hypothetical protein